MNMQCFQVVSDGMFLPSIFRKRIVLHPATRRVGSTPLRARYPAVTRLWDEALTLTCRRVGFSTFPKPQIRKGKFCFQSPPSVFDFELVAAAFGGRGKRGEELRRKKWKWGWRRRGRGGKNSQARPTLARPKADGLGGPPVVDWREREGGIILYETQRGSQRVGGERAPGRNIVDPRCRRSKISIATSSSR